MKNTSLYILSGEEPLLLNEALTNIETNLRTAGFIEKQLFDQDNKETWEQFMLACDTRSLFAEKTRLLCRFPSQKVSDAAQTALQHFVKRHPSDKALIIIFGKLTSAQLNAQWFQALKQAGTFTQIWPVTLKQFPSWVKQRFQRAGYPLDEKALQLLCDHTEGNLLAAQQCLEKLQLLSAPGKVTEKDLIQCLAPNARYNIFDLVNAVSQKQLVKLQTILETLQADGTEPALILWALARECRKQQRQELIPALNQVDQLLKGLQAGAVWPALQRACFEAAGRPLI